ncbi:MAG: phosphonopyruvate decarboxylase [Candidatus Dormibacteraceae bacterium]
MPGRMVTDVASAAAPTWPQHVYELLKSRGVTTVGYVPDAGHRVLIELAENDPDVVAVPLTTEEEGIGLIAGADLGSGRAVLLLQSSGVGNCVNMLSLVKGAGFPMLLLVSMRGDFGEGNPWQFAMGEAVEPVLQAMGVRTLRVDAPSDVVPTVDAAATMVFGGGRAVAVLLTQRLIGAKSFA